MQRIRINSAHENAWSFVCCIPRSARLFTWWWHQPISHDSQLAVCVEWTAAVLPVSLCWSVGHAGITQESVNTCFYCGTRDRPIGTLRVVTARELVVLMVPLRPTQSQWDGTAIYVVRWATGDTVTKQDLYNTMVIVRCLLQARRPFLTSLLQGWRARNKSTQASPATGLEPVPSAWQGRTL